MILKDEKGRKEWDKKMKGWAGREEGQRIGLLDMDMERSDRAGRIDARRKTPVAVAVVTNPESGHRYINGGAGP